MLAVNLLCLSMIQLSVPTALLIQLSGQVKQLSFLMNQLSRPLIQLTVKSEASL
ncbi:hypothetical protein [Jeotgalibacillus malaysiensis]|uniref:hypothetical protein n=1 Tax=Jeotgalibacillus malaysiensis TaxID=1508404 RepID=UPI00384E9DB0